MRGIRRVGEDSAHTRVSCATSVIAIRSGVSGSSVSRAPVASWIALAMDGPLGSRKLCKDRGASADFH
jgi:hypothetical protein